MKIRGVILAGGKSSRMGRDKGLTVVNGKPMVQWIIETLLELPLNPPVIIANNPEYERFGIPVFQDVVKDKGPLGGIYTAMEMCSDDALLIVSCDTPFVEGRVLEKLISGLPEKPVKVLRYDSGTHYLMGIYSVAVKEKLKTFLDANRLRVSEFVEACSASYINVGETEVADPENCFRNINRLEDLKNSSV